VNPDQNSVSALDARGKTLLFEAPAGQNPRTLALGPGGDVWVASQDDPSVVILNGQNGSSRAVIRLPFASRPYGIVFDPAGQNAYVTLEATGRLIRINPSTRQITGTLDLGPTPRGLAVSHDGSRVLVTRHLSRMTRPGAADYGEVWEVGGATFVLTRAFRLEADTAADGKDNGRGVPNNLNSIVISPDGRKAYVPCTKANTQKGMALDGTKPTFETSVRTILIQIDLEKNKEDMATRKDVDNRSMASSFILDRMGAFGYLNLHGNNRTSILKGHSLFEFSALPAIPNTPEDVLQGKARGAAPVGLVLDPNDSLLFVHYFLSREVGVYDVTKAGGADTIPRLAMIKTIAQETLPVEILAGKQIFHNAGDLRMSMEGYVNCAVCHVDGAIDNRVWDFTDRGEGLRRTTNLLGRAGMGHGPVHWSANFDEIQDFEHDMRGPFGGEGFLDPVLFNQGTRNAPLGDKKAGLSPELDALAAYVSSLAAVRPSPYRNADGSRTTDAVAGKAIFLREETGCAKCHVPPLYTDSKLPKPGDPVNPGPVTVFAGAKSWITDQGFLLHDVGTLKPASGKRLNDTLRGLDTPTLKGIWENGSFFHDGSAAGVMEVLTTAYAGDKHGKTSNLNPEELRQLQAFLLQLDELDDAGNPLRLSGSGPRRSAAGLTVRVMGRRVEFQLPSAGPHRLRLLDVRGLVLREIWVPAGQNRWVWDGNARRGRRASPGIYFLRAESRGIPQSLRFLFP
jgi:DNA-binding beta-propeller fold protein YncE/mono/diheme cytochrome c family protein